MSRIYALALAAFFALASAAYADKVEMGVTMSKADFAALKTRMIGQLDSERYADIAPKDKAAVTSALDRIEQRLAKSPKSEQDLVDIFNDQELINQVLARAKDDSRMFCQRDQQTGSHVTKVTCMSMANWALREKQGQDAMRALVDNHRNTCPGCICDTATCP